MIHPSSLSAKSTAAATRIFPPDLEPEFHSESAVFRTCATSGRMEPWKGDGRFGSITVALRTRALIGRGRAKIPLVGGRSKIDVYLGGIVKLGLLLLSYVRWPLGDAD